MTEIEVEIDGKLYRASYEIRKRVLYVRTAHGEKTAHAVGLDSAGALTIARIVLGEMVREGKA